MTSIEERADKHGSDTCRSKIVTFPENPEQNDQKIRGYEEARSPAFLVPGWGEYRKMNIFLLFRYPFRSRKNESAGRIFGYLCFSPGAGVVFVQAFRFYRLRIPLRFALIGMAWLVNAIDDTEVFYLQRDRAASPRG